MARKGLGRGLGALIDTDSEQPAVTNKPDTLIDIRKIEPNRNQPRQYFDEVALEELADSIRNYGIIQPLILKDCGNYYSIIAGERRFRAARVANLDFVPAVIKEYTELETLQIALIENIQRKDLTPIEEALCYKRLIEDFFFSQEDISEKVGKTRSNIANMLRLLELDAKVQDLVSFGNLTISHAKILLAVKNTELQLLLAQQIAAEDLSVRATEILVNAALETATTEPDSQNSQGLPNLSSTKPELQAAYLHAEEELKTILGTKVSIVQGKKKGKIEIEYYSPDELDRLLMLLKATER
ncbi:MAG: ParB/RepB/Spo0J family partition protein [Firmicutes bacterium]|nr:ParB/RepB/Spo0J family partition protein [Bacillota bacterium]